MNNIFRQLFKFQFIEEQRSPYHSTPNPEEILHANLRGKKNQGLKVNWDLTIQSMFNDFDPREIVVLTSFRKSSAEIWITILVESNPEIYDYGSGSQVNVKGEVKSIQGRNIYLENCQLQFLPSWDGEG